MAAILQRLVDEHLGALSPGTRAQDAFNLIIFQEVFQPVIAQQKDVLTFKFEAVLVFGRLIQT